MASLRLTDRTLRSLSTEKVREDVYDAIVPAFMVRLGRNGSKTFYFRYRDGSRYRRIRIGTYPAMSLADGRDKARELQVQVTQGEDPAGERARFKEGPTVAELAHEYVERYAKRRKRSWREDQRLLEREVLPKWGERKAADIKRRDVLELLDETVQRGAPVLANRVLAVVRRSYNWAIELEILDANPCARVRRPVEEKPRTRVLSEQEIRTLWTALDEEHSVIAAAFRLLLLTGQRMGEVMRMEWGQIDRDLWTIPAEIAKNGSPHVVPLARQAMTILDGLRGLDPTWVLASPSPRGGRCLYPTSLTGATARIRRRLDIPKWSLHDLRRTAASRMAEMGIDEFVVGRVLGHSYKSVTAIYNHYNYLREKREALSLWGERVAKIVATGVPAEQA